MSIVPAFRIGLWNAWWFMIVFVLQWLAIMLLPGDLMKRTGDIPENQTRQYKTASLLSNGIWVAATLYSIFLPLKLGTPWLWVGLPVFVVGLVILALTTVAIATTPKGKPFTSGVYRFSRHPGYLSMVGVYLGVSVAAASWVFLLTTVVTFFLLLYGARIEEAYCCARFGEAYRSYVLRTPRWIGLPKPAAH